MQVPLGGGQQANPREASIRLPGWATASGKVPQPSSPRARPSANVPNSAWQQRASHTAGRRAAEALLAAAPSRDAAACEAPRCPAIVAWAW